MTSPSAWSLPEIVSVASPSLLGAFALSEGQSHYGFGLLLCAVTIVAQTELVKVLLKEVAS
jgi:hypothetical protein